MGKSKKISFSTKNTFFLRDFKFSKKFSKYPKRVEMIFNKQRHFELCKTRFLHQQNNEKHYCMFISYRKCLFLVKIPQFSGQNTSFLGQNTKLLGKDSQFSSQNTQFFEPELKAYQKNKSLCLGAV